MQFPIIFVVAVYFRLVSAATGNPTCDYPPIIDGTIQSQLQDLRHPLGTSVTYQCEFGYVSRGLKGFQSMCQFDEQTETAKWTDPNISCIPRSCGDPGFVVNADRIGEVFTFPYQVQFECHVGYKLQGLTARFCQANGEWSGTLPECKPISCSHPRDPQNGRVIFSSVKYGAELQYKCNIGFILKNYERRFCSDDGTWSNKEPVCIEAACEMPQNPEHGTVQLLSDPKVNSIALFTCDADRMLVGASASKCLITGQWTFPPPKCLRTCTVPVVDNGSLGSYERVRISGYRTEEQFVQIQAGTEIKHGETMDLLCNEGFMVVELTKAEREAKGVTCNDGQWSKTLQCKTFSCFGDAPPIEGGYPVVNKRTHGHTIYYRCNENFVKSKSGRVTCVYGQWTGYTPECVDGISVRCYSKDLDIDGLTKPNFEYLPHGRSFLVSCLKGYRVSGDLIKMECKLGRWTLPHNPCIEENCVGQPPQIGHGRIKMFNPDPRSEVQYECDPGFQMRGPSAVQCRLGEWTGNPTSCIDSSTTTTTTKPQVVFGKQTTGPLEFPSSALASRETTRQEESCFCSFLSRDPSIEVEVNGRKLQYGYNINKGEKASIRCKDLSKYLIWPNGLTMYGSANVTCTVCERWEPDRLPFCSDLSEGPAWITSDGKFNLQPGGVIEVHKGEDIEFVCHTWNVGHPHWSASHLWNNALYSMTVSGEWRRFNTLLRMSEVRPEQSGRYQCAAKNQYGDTYIPTVLDLTVIDVDVRCTILDKKGSFNINYSNGQEIGSISRYSCKDASQILSGSGTRICQETGDWSPAEPKCADTVVRCAVLDEKKSFDINYSKGQEIESVARYSCKDASQVLSGSETRMCQETGDWSSGEPKCTDTVVRCAVLDDKESFDINYSNYQEIDSVAWYTCKDVSLVFSGPQTRICQENGEWSSVEPKCADTAVRCTVLDKKESYNIYYSNGQEIGSVAHYLCNDASQILSGSETRTCQETGYWSSVEPVCVDRAVRCTVLETKRSFDINYSNGQEIGSIARYSCKDISQIFRGSETRICQETGIWSSVEPRCVENNVECPRIDGKGKLIIRYSDWIRPENSIATITCKKSGQRLTGMHELTCQPNGEWSGEVPECVDITCPEFKTTEVLKVSYSNGNKPLSFATFQCVPPTSIVGSDFSMCRYNGTWTKPQPSCEAPGCSLKDLVPFASGIILDTKDVADELLPSGSELRLRCEENLVLFGNKMATCGPLGNWDIGDARCVMGCYFNIGDVTSQLIVEPIKDNYRFGEFVVLRCPDGHKLTSDVQKVMCLGSSWSNPVPECEQVEDE